MVLEYLTPDGLCDYWSEDLVTVTIHIQSVPCAFSFYSPKRQEDWLAGFCLPGMDTVPGQLS